MDNFFKSEGNFSIFCQPLVSSEIIFSQNFLFLTRDLPGECLGNFFGILDFLPIGNTYSRVPNRRHGSKKNNTAQKEH